MLDISIDIALIEIEKKSCQRKCDIKPVLGRFTEGESDFAKQNRSIVDQKHDNTIYWL
jgi:hypothetical protein